MLRILGEICDYSRLNLGIAQRMMFNFTTMIMVSSLTKDNAIEIGNSLTMECRKLA